MRSLPGNYAGLGQHDLKGKKTKLLSCGCCVMENLKQKELDKEHRKEMREAYFESQVQEYEESESRMPYVQATESKWDE